MAGTAGLIGAAAALAGHAAQATFKGTGQVVQGAATTAGSLYLSVPSYPNDPAGGGAGSFDANRMQLTVSNLQPDSVGTNVANRVLDVKVGGSLDLAGLSLTVHNVTANAAGDVMLKDTNFGMIVDKCSVGWTPAGTAPTTYSCTGGTRTNIFGDDSNAGFTPYVLVAPVDRTTEADKVYDLLAGDQAGPSSCANPCVSLTAGSVNHLRFRFKIYVNGDNAEQGGTATLQFTFSGTQRAGTNK
jgi:spore coat-associated protein N